MQSHHSGDIFYLSPFKYHQVYDAYFPLLILLGHCLGFGEGGEEGGCVVVGWEVKGAFGVGIAPI